MRFREPPIGTIWRFLLRAYSVFRAALGDVMRACDGRRYVVVEVRGKAGFSLVELMVTISVLAIILSISVPSFIGVVNRNRLAAGANELVASMQMARSEALRRNSSISVCRSEDGTTCAGSAGSWRTWLTVDSDDEILRDNRVGASVELSSKLHTVSFRGDGTTRDVGGDPVDAEFVACVPTTIPAENTRLVTIGFAGRVSIEPHDGGGVCP